MLRVLLGDITGVRSTALFGGVQLIGKILKSLAPTAGAVRYNWKHDGLIHCMEARRGRGKSYNLTDLIHWCATNRLQVRANVRSMDYVQMAFRLCMDGSFKSVKEAAEWLSENVIYLDTWDDLLTSYDCMVIIDEATRLFEGRKGCRRSRPRPSSMSGCNSVVSFV